MRRRGARYVAACVLAAPLLVACTGSGDATPTAATTAPTPIGRLHPGEVQVARAQFCDQVSSAAVRGALGAKPEGDDSWSNGDPVPGSTGSGDVGHEIGCAWAGPGGTAARAWVFARPVSADLAGTLVTAAGRQQGCTAEPASAFGTPALLQTCTPAAGTERLRRAGLFGDSWLTCELTVPASVAPATRRQRLDAWCAAVVAALRVG